ncbi:MAG: response regulator [Bacteroidia bacterium]|nr:response regulator [Bacteroidia bacterium]
MRKTGFKKMKFTVIAGYLLVVVVMTLGLYCLYRNLVNYSSQKIRNEDLSSLLIVGNTLSKLYEVESDQNLFTAENARQYFLRYDSLVPEIQHNLILLKQTTHHPSHVNKVDTIVRLINDKKENLQAVALLLDSLNRMPEVTGNEHTFRVIVDTLINKVRYSEQLDMARQKELQRVFSQQLDTMYTTNRMLTARIDDLLKDIEQDEMSNSLRLVTEKGQILRGSQRTMFVISVLAILIALSFSILFLVDIHKSQRYRRQLERSLKRISRLLASREKLMLAISHDIKAPISSIMGYIDLMDKSVSKPENKFWLSNMKHSAEHVLELVSMLLDHHQLEAGKWKPNEINFSLPALAAMTTDSFKPLAQQKGLAYHVENNIPAEMICFGDPYMMRQIMSNLLSNAIKYTAEGAVTIVTAVNEKEGRKWFFFSVSDTGEGIEVSNYQYIFQEFSRLHVLDCETGQIEGCGLGLAITKGFVNVLQGSITLTSEKDKGSEFVVEIPLKAATQQVEETKSDWSDLEGVNVLVVDDDPIQLTMMAGMLQKKKMQCMVEANPEKVLSHLSKNRFDIVFMDIRMPHINGISLVEKVRLRHDIAELPIIALSARSEISAAELHTAGFSGYLPKPFSSDTLYGVIHYYVKEQQKEISYQPLPMSLHTKGAAALIDFVKEDKQVSREILQSFVKETTANIEQLKEMFATKEEASLSDVAHKMLPLFRMMGDDVLVDLLCLLEEGYRLRGKQETTLLDKLMESVKEAEGLLIDME